METTNLLNENVEETKVADMNLDLSAIRKKRIAVDGDPNRIIELNTSDLGIIKRLEHLSERMSELSTKFVDIKYDEDLEEVAETSEITKQIKVIDDEMRSIIDELFQSPVSDVCVPDGTMFDMFNGEFCYELLIGRLLMLYNDNISDETQKVRDRINKHTNKYLTQDHKSKRKG